MDVIVVKSTNHFYNGFAPLVGRVIYCDAPGSATEDLSALPYRRLARPVWPLDPVAQCRAAMGLPPSEAGVAKD
jgi:microcystin degradation protein MlrC